MLQGLSGTGKGTTVSKLQAALPRAVSWSNGNVFRALTLLAVSRFIVDNLAKYVMEKQEYYYGMLVDVSKDFNPDPEEVRVCLSLKNRS